MTEKEKMLAGKIYDSSDKELAELRTKAHKLSQQYSSLYEDDERRNAILHKVRLRLLCKLQSDSA